MEKTRKNEKNMNENGGAAGSASISFHIRSYKNQIFVSGFALKISKKGFLYINQEQMDDFF